MTWQMVLLAYDVAAGLFVLVMNHVLRETQDAIRVAVDTLDLYDVD